LLQGYLIVPAPFRGRVRERVLNNSFFHPPLNPLPSREGAIFF
jgi:hypothetical protein